MDTYNTKVCGTPGHVLPTYYDNLGFTILPYSTFSMSKRIQAWYSKVHVIGTAFELKDAFADSSHAATLARPINMFETTFLCCLAEALVSLDTQPSFQETHMCHSSPIGIPVNSTGRDYSQSFGPSVLRKRARRQARLAVENSPVRHLKMVEREPCLSDYATLFFGKSSSRFLLNEGIC